MVNRVELKYAPMTDELIVVWWEGDGKQTRIVQDANGLGGCRESPEGIPVEVLSHVTAWRCGWRASLEWLRLNGPP